MEAKENIPLLRMVNGQRLPEIKFVHQHTELNHRTVLLPRIIPGANNYMINCGPDKLTGKAIENGHSTIVCCGQFVFFLEDLVGASNIFCQKCQRISCTKIESAK